MTRGPKSALWRGGAMALGDRGRYTQVKRVACPDEYSTMARADGTVAEHRLRMAERIGRPLWPWEVVHHVDHDHRNNDPENLELFPSNLAHKYAEHGQLLIGSYCTLTSPEDGAMSAPKINPQLEPFLRPISELKPHPRNPVEHPESQLAKIQGMFTTYGIQFPIVTLEDGTIVAGHARVKVCERLGWDAIPCITFATLDEADEWITAADDLEDVAEGFMVGDNRSADERKWRKELLQEIIDSQRAIGRNIELALGFTQDDLAKMFREVETEQITKPEIDHDAPEPTAVQDELWRLGEHLVLCADSQLLKNVERLFPRGEQAQCVFTDPPYGISYTDREGRHREIAGDELRDDDLVALVQKALKWAVRFATEDAAFYVWHSPTTREDFLHALQHAGLQERQYLIWVKDAFTLGGADYQHGYEPCFYLSRAGQKPAFFGDRAQSTIWRCALVTDQGELALALENGIKIMTGEGQGIFVKADAPKSHKLRMVRLEPEQHILLEQPNSDRDAWKIQRDPGSSYQHPTQKPIALARRAIQNSTEPGHIVYDAFGGSGSTLLAAEETGRQARICEIEPGYVDTIVARWEALTGEEAERIE